MNDKYFAKITGQFFVFITSFLVMEDLDLAWPYYASWVHCIGLAISSFDALLTQLYFQLLRLLVGFRTERLQGIGIICSWKIFGGSDAKLERFATAAGVVAKPSQDNCNDQTWLLTFRSNGKNCYQACAVRSIIKKNSEGP